jgi:PTH1 family peptidyl-tRNA hydrolase
MDKFLIVGLGNIGSEYDGTRHNIGFQVVDFLAQKHSALFQTGRLADVSYCKIKGKMLVLIKPTTFMNLSGRAVKYWLDKENIAPENLLVILDDLAIPLSKLRLRPAGSDGGHNGLKSIQESLGSANYARLRFGIGATYPKGRQVEFVLGKWDEAEIPVVKRKVEKSAELVETYVLRGLEPAMNEVNKMDFSS